MSQQAGINSFAPEVMVSYSSQDRAQVKQFVQRLRAAGVRVWIDFGGIDGAQRWGEEIVNAIEGCKTVILMVSRVSMESENIAKEVMLGWERGKKFLPVCLEDATIPNSMQYQLAGIQKILLYDGDPEAKFMAVLRALVRIGVGVSPFSMALIHAEVGDKEQAIQNLNVAFDRRAGALAKLKTEPRFSFLRSDPRFVDLTKRIEGVELESEDSTADVPVFLVPAPARTKPAGPLPLWQRFIWPDIYDGDSARAAAAQGIFGSVFLVVASIFAGILSTTTTTPVFGIGWSSPLVVAVIFAPIAFGVWKMSRPAALVGLALSGLGAFGNLTAVSALQTAMTAYARYPNYPNPIASQYYYSWFSLVVSAVCVLTFANATRGTLAYRQMVRARQTPDKQDALTKEEFVAIRRNPLGMFKKSHVVVATPVATPMAPPTAKAVVSAPRAIETVPAEIVSPPPLAPVSQTVVPYTAPAKHSFAETIGVRRGSISFLKMAGFTAANLIAALIYVELKSANSVYAMPSQYWNLWILESLVFSAVVLLLFGILRNSSVAAGVAALLTTVIAVPLYSMLDSFVWGDLFYREQFDQFVLLPLVSYLVLLLGLVILVPRVQPLPLALWLPAIGSPIITSFVSDALHSAGAGPFPDPWLVGTSVVYPVVRSLAFAFVLWGALLLIQKIRRASIATDLAG